MCDRGISRVRPRKEILKESLALSSQRQVDPRSG